MYSNVAEAVGWLSRMASGLLSPISTICNLLGLESELNTTPTGIGLWMTSLV